MVDKDVGLCVASSAVVEYDILCIMQIREYCCCVMCVTVTGSACYCDR